MSKKPLVSLVIPVKNGSSTIGRCLDSLVKQSYKNIEVVIIDNFSTDNTPKIARDYCRDDKRVKFYQKGPERASQMNFGVSRASGKYVFVTSCDMVLDKNFIKLCVKKCEEEGYDACNGHIKSETHGFWSKVKAMERQMYVDDKLMETALFYNKDIFLKLGGFDETMVGVEEEFQHRLDESGLKTGIINSYQTHIDEIDSIKEIILKSFYYGQYDTTYFKKHHLRAFKKRFPIRIAFIKNFSLLTRHIDLLIGFVIFKIIQYSAGFSGLLIGFLSSPKKGRLQKLIYEG